MTDVSEPAAYVLACRYCGGPLFADGEGGWSCPVRDRHTALLRVPPSPYPSAWQLIETAPKDGSTVLGYTPYSSVLVGDVYYSVELEQWERLPDAHVRPTHWQALPAPPRAASPAGAPPLEK